MKRFAIAVNGAALLVALAGCGGAGDGGRERLSKADYELKLQAVDRETATASQALGLKLEQLSTAPAGVDLDATAKATAEAQKAARGAADEYEALSPPEEVQDLNDRLAKGTRAFASDLDELKTAAEGGDRDAASDFARAVTGGELESLKELAKVGAGFREKGYRTTA